MISIKLILSCTPISTIVSLGPLAPLALSTPTRRSCRHCPREGAVRSPHGALGVTEGARERTTTAGTRNAPLGLNMTRLCMYEQGRNIYLMTQYHVARITLTGRWQLLGNQFIYLSYISFTSSLPELIEGIRFGHILLYKLCIPTLIKIDAKHSTFTRGMH